MYNEVFEIIDSCTFAAKNISQVMWKAFELMHKTFKLGAELYLEDMLPALDNFVQYGAGHLITQPQYVKALYEMVVDMFTDQKVGNSDRICACKLAEAMMLSLRGHIDACVSGFIEISMGVLSSAEVKIKSYKIHLMEMVINGIYYNPALALHCLEQKGVTNKFFTLWFSSIDQFSRVHDKTLCIVAIVALLGLTPEQVPESVKIGWPRLLVGILSLFHSLPFAIQNREAALRDDFTFDAGTYDYEDEGEWNDEDAAGQWTEEEDTAEAEPTETRDESSAYLEFLNEEVCVRFVNYLVYWKITLLPLFPRYIFSLTINNFACIPRPKSSASQLGWKRKRTNLERIQFFLNLLLTSLSLISSLEMQC